MLVLVRLGILPVMAALLLLLSVTAPPVHRSGGAGAADQATITVPLEPVGASGVEGRATIVRDPSGPRRARLSIEAAGLRPGAAHVVHLRAGRPSRPSAGFGLVGELVADPTGLARLEAAHLVVSATGETIELTLDLLADGDHFIEFHAPSMVVVAVAEIPPARS